MFARTTRESPGEKQMNCCRHPNNKSLRSCQLMTLLISSEVK